MPFGGCDLNTCVIYVFRDTTLRFCTARGLVPQYIRKFGHTKSNKGKEQPNDNPNKDTVVSHNKRPRKPDRVELN